MTSGLSYLQRGGREAVDDPGKKDDKCVIVFKFIRVFQKKGETGY